jgi:hypothetical protein
LYSKLEFVPEDRFSPEAKMLLEGLINRDPSLRLGAWENPPKDIMNSPFFDIIQWDAVYERRQDGPYIPELPSFMKKRKEYDQSPLSAPSLSMSAGGGGGSSGAGDIANVATAAVAVTGGDWKKIEFSPCPLDRMTIPDPVKEEEEKKKQAKTNQKNEQQQQQQQNRSSDEQEDDEDGDDDSDEESEEESEEEEEIAIRDSVFVGSQAMANNQNQLPDWSFIDEAVLMSYITNAAQEGKEKQKKSKNKDKKDKEKSKKNVQENSADVADSGTVVEGEVGMKGDEKKMETIEEGKEEEEEVVGGGDVTEGSPVPAISSSSEEVTVYQETGTSEAAPESGPEPTQS